MKTLLLAILTVGLLVANASRLAAVCQDPPSNPGGEGTPKPSPSPAKPTPSPTPAKPIN